MAFDMNSSKHEEQSFRLGVIIDQYLLFSYTFLHFKTTVKSQYIINIEMFHLYKLSTLTTTYIVNGRW